jgi:acetyltransferase
MRIRPIEPADKEALAAGYLRLSDETIRRRFLTPKPRLSAAELRYLTEIDGHDHVAFVASPVEHPDWIVAVARFVRNAEDPRSAEFAIVVGDRYQRCGLGSALARSLIEAAREHDVARFTATSLSDNVAVRRLVATISEHLVYDRNSSGIDEVVLDIAA